MRALRSNWRGERGPKLDFLPPTHLERSCTAAELPSARLGTYGLVGGTIGLVELTPADLQPRTHRRLILRPQLLMGPLPRNKRPKPKPKATNSSPSTPLLSAAETTASVGSPPAAPRPFRTHLLPLIQRRRSSLEQSVGGTARSVLLSEKLAKHHRPLRAQVCPLSRRAAVPAARSRDGKPLGAFL